MYQCVALQYEMLHLCVALLRNEGSVIKLEDEVEDEEETEQPKKKRKHGLNKLKHHAQN